MAHKTLIDGTAYEISGGKTLVDGTAYSIKNGKTLVGGTAYEVAFGPDFVTVYDFGSVASQAVFYYNECVANFDTLPFDPAKCNAFMVNGVVYNAEYSNDLSGPYNKVHYLTMPGGEIAFASGTYPFALVFNQTVSTGKWKVSMRVYMAGTYNFAIGTI